MSTVDLPTILRFLAAEQPGAMPADYHPIYDAPIDHLMPRGGPSVPDPQTQMDLTGSPIPGNPPLAPVNEPARSLSPNTGFSAVLDSIARSLSARPLETRPTGNSTQNNAASFITHFGNRFAQGRGQELSRADAIDEALKVEAAKRNERNLKISDNARELARARWDKRMERKQKLADEKDLLTFKAGLEPDEATKGKNEAVRLVARNAELRARGERIPGEGSGIMSGLSVVNGEIDPAALAEAVYSGRHPPDLRQYGRPVQAAVGSILEKRYKFDLQRAFFDYSAQLQYFKSNNTSLPLRLRQSIENASATLDAAEAENAKLSSLMPRFGATPLNKIAQTAAKEGLGDAQTIASAQSLTSYVNALQFELANIYQGGGVPTDQAQKKASSIINANMGPERLAAAIAAARREVSWRQSAISSAGPVTTSNRTGFDRSTIRFTDGKGKFWNIPANDAAAVAKARAKLTEVPVGR